jgi:hypothetical protein
VQWGLHGPESVRLAKVSLHRGLATSVRGHVGAPRSPPGAVVGLAELCTERRTAPQDYSAVVHIILVTSNMVALTWH